MTTISQRLRHVANCLVQLEGACEHELAPELRAIASELEAPAADAPKVVMLWREALPDGRYDHNAKNEPLIRQRDYIATVSALQEETASLRQQLSYLAECQQYKGNSVSFIYQKKDAYASAIDKVFDVLGKYGYKADGSTHVADLTDKALCALQARINELKARQVPASAGDEYFVVWPDGGRFFANTLKYAEDYMSGAVPSCAKRGVEPPVIVRYAPAETVPYAPQPDTSKEQP